MLITFYTTKHEWIAIEDGVATVGITGHAASELGDITFVELPEVDTEVETDGELGVIESVKAAADVYAPVGGLIVEVNERLEDEPELINSDAECEGWLCRMTDIDCSVLESLMDISAYEQYLEKE